MRKHANIIAGLIVAVCAASCNRTNYNMLDMIPAEAEFAAVFSPTHAAEGITVGEDDGLQFPASLAESASAVKDIEAVNGVLRGSGVEPDSIGVYMLTYADEPVYVLKLDDAERFVKRLEAMGYTFLRGQQGIKIYCTDSERGAIVATRGNVAVLVDSEGREADDMWSCFIKADANPMSLARPAGTFVKGDVSQAAGLPEAVKGAVTAKTPSCKEVLGLVKTVTDLF